MRLSVSPKVGKSAVKVILAAFLASAATGCSSDATRFDGLLSSTDNFTTNSIPRGQYAGAADGQAPVPRGDVAGAQPAYPSSYPAAQSDVSYEPINTATHAGSGARMATMPASVQRTELTAPAAAGSSERSVALAQPMPAGKRAGGGVISDSTIANTAAPAAKAAPSKNGWSSVNAPSVQLRAGESIATLSKRYGVPEKEILKANGLKSAAAAAPGQAIVIPTYGTPRNPTKVSAEAVDLANQKKLPTPHKGPEQEVAVLPSGASGRDKSQASSNDASGKLAAGNGDPAGAKGGSYVVKPGDSLIKIARDAGTSVEALKAANGITTASIRIGQTLALPGAGATDGVNTSSIAAKAENAEKKVAAEPAVAKQPEGYKAPVQTASISEVESKADVKDVAPEATGIGKYRWPVRGAVINAYGANVDGNRNDGINISVPQGTAIKAAENGVVIYAGNGLKELGNTVLVRHDDGTVTVYGHADTLNVTRGQKVQRGQTLAASGMSGSAKRPQVHFEVRKDATPVNPMSFLE
ncbi:peptidoglycan DD-metalloendopeptidase family protein [Ferirhizobium litorale]|uniref:Peptidoglycan DD-metalloendopeptidase family protein n=1 Tax=Ferirhizobium litorale TaxID=2927786 RepID=A0AAE3QFF3_9HYPH|nr:peptidoglycan DD-metalloendopeptidase family protein [Fererhizobium litorale]MDI7922943.1 peptidoglycan DD-metalloendopeptidase family protein [Fererhizobium litorale]